MPFAAQTLFPTPARQRTNKHFSRPRDNRPSASERGYDARWQLARKVFLGHNPLCVECKARDVLMPANVVDHIIPHRGNMALFWDTTNWQALCERCHNRKTARGE